MVHIHVIIPVYNAKKYLREAVDSVLNQPYKGIDIVLVNDGSSDGSAELCDEIAGKEERVSVIHQKNGGVSAARNTGIEYVLAKHKDDLEQQYIAFLDADDKWVESFLNCETQSLFREAYSLVGFQSCACNGDLSRRVVPSVMKDGVHTGGVNSIWLHSGQAFCAMFYSARLLKEYGIRFVPGLKYTEDKIFIMQCLYLAENVCLENKLLYYYRMAANSAMHRRQFGMPYYVPVIDAYLASDQAMSQWKTPQRGELRDGRVLAGIYIMDMIEEHYQQFGSCRELDKLFAEKPEYLTLMDSPLIQKSKRTRERWTEMNVHPYRFRLRCYLRGITFKVKRCLYVFLYRNKYFAAIIDKKRYPVMIEK